MAGRLGDDDERYFEDEVEPPRKSFDAALLSESLKVLPARRPLVFTPEASVTAAVRAMQRERRGCVLITGDGTCDSKLLGIFSDRDVLYRIVDRGRNPALLPLREVMTADPECVPREATIAWVLNRMAVGGFRHVPVVGPDGHPHSVVSVRDVVDFLVEFFPREVLNLPPEFNRPVSTRREGG
jgi:CBS domain-containing protein